MTAASVALLLGLLVAPVALLWLGHGFRALSRRGKRVFWGGVLGHTTGAFVTLALLLSPPVLWAGGARGLALHWSLVLGATLGAVTGWVWGTMRK